MPGRIAMTTQLAREYAEKHPQLATNTIARMLLEKEPEVFNSLNTARQAVRWVRGERANGEGRKTPDPIAKVHISLPKSYAPQYTPIMFPFQGYGTILGDTHIPYHDEVAIEAAMEKVQAKGAMDFLLLNGDIIDAHPLSRFQIDPRLRSFKEEMDATKQFLDYLAQYFDNIIFKFGNHSDRFERYMMRAAPQLLECGDFELSKLLDLEGRDITYVPASVPIFAGSLSILHGHEHGRGASNPVNPARGQFLRGASSSLVGHWHRTSQHTQNTIRGKTLSFWSLGCLCSLHPAYQPFNQWDQGFACMHFDGKDYEIEPHRIVKGRVY